MILDIAVLDDSDFKNPIMKQIKKIFPLETCQH